MAESYKFIAPDTTELTLSNFTLVDEGEVGMALPSNYSTVGAQQDGALWQGVRLVPRILNVVWDSTAATRSAMWTEHQTFISAMKPYSTASTLRKTLPDDTYYDLNVRINSGLTFKADEQIAAATQRYAIQFIAYDPVWNKQPQATHTVTLGELTELEFPITFPIEFGSTTIDDTDTVTTSGTWKAYPVITITGPVTSPIISNNTTDEKLDFAGTTVASGDTYTLDLTAGTKTVVDGSSVNKIGDLTTDSDLGTWHLAAAPEATSGNNTIRVQGSAAVVGTTSFVIAWYNRFVGL